MNDNLRNDRFALASLVCGILSIFIFPVLFGGLAIIMGVSVRNAVSAQGGSKDTRTYHNANLGILFGVLGILLWVFTLLAASYLQIDVNSLMGGGTAASQSQSAF